MSGQLRPISYQA